MEIEHTSSSEFSTDCSLNSESVKITEKLYKKFAEADHVGKGMADFEFLLDLRNLPSVCDHHFEEEDSLENLPTMVIQQTEDSDTRVNSESSHECADEKTNSILRERIQSLRQIMINLGEELKREVALWRKEREEFQFLRERIDSLALEEATTAARAAAAAYAAESPLSNDLGEALDITSEETLRELTILEYEKKLAKYQDEFSLTQAEKRYNTHWQLVARAYKEKLMEVERLCNEELEKVRRNASHLEPLKEIVSQWNFHEENHGDSKTEPDSGGLMHNNKNLKEAVLRNSYSFHKVGTKVNMIPEIFTAKFKSEDPLKQNTTYEHL